MARALRGGPQAQAVVRDAAGLGLSHDSVKGVHGDDLTHRLVLFRSGALARVAQPGHGGGHAYRQERAHLMTNGSDRHEGTMRWAVEELRRVMRPPADGGDTIDWDVLRAETGWELPADYRDFVAVYGLGGISDSIGILTPPFDGYPYGDHLLYGAQWPPVDGTLTWASNEAGDDFLWRCVGDPDEWGVALRLRDRRRDHEYDMGMAEFLLRLVRRDIHPPLGAELELPATFESWREEDRRLLDEDGDLEGF